MSAQVLTNCKLEGCARSLYGHTGLCSMHYQRLRRNGDVGTASSRFERACSVEGCQVMLEAQGRGCAICGYIPGDGQSRLAVDHCHDTGAVRGLLCADCNLSLGWFEIHRPEIERHMVVI